MVKDFDSNEPALMESFYKGQPEAIDFLFRKYYVSLVDFATRLIQNLHESQDIVVNIFEKLHKKKEDFTKHREIKSFLFVATRNACMDYLRSRKTEEKYQKESTYLAAVTDNADEFDFLRMDVQIMQTIEEEVAGLPERTRTVYDLIVKKKMSLQEIADHLGLTVRTIQRERANAIDRLRNSLIKKDLLDISIPVYIFLFCMAG